MIDFIVNIHSNIVNYLESIRIFDIKLFDTDLYELVLRLAISVGVSYYIINKVYQPTRKDSDYLFTFMILNPLIFFVCKLFSNVELEIGFAFGLFAVFSILRYRTAQIQVKEMTYMFIVITIAVINALASKKISYAELVFTNLFIILFTAFMEKYTSNGGVSMQIIRYDIIDNVKPENESLLLADLKKRIGKDVIRYEIIETDYIRDSAKIRVFHVN